MDVKKLIVLVSCAFIFVNCDKRSGSGSNQFTKTTNPTCEDQSLKGEYLVRWKDGHISVENYADDETFIKEFVECFIFENNF